MRPGQWECQQKGVDGGKKGKSQRMGYGLWLRVKSRQRGRLNKCCLIIIQLYFSAIISSFFENKSFVCFFSGFKSNACLLWKIGKYKN